MARMSGGKQHRDPDADVEQAIAAFRQAYREGEKIAERVDREGRYGRGIVQDEARVRGINEDAVRKLRQFARSYTEKELDELCQCCRKHGRALGVSFVAKFVTIPRERKQRKKFQEEVIRERWSQGRIDKEIRVRFGRRRQGGKQPALAETVEGVLAQLDGVCLQWHRMIKRLQQRDEANGQQDKSGGRGKQLPGLRDLPGSLGAKVDVAAISMELLRDAITAELDADRGG